MTVLITLTTVGTDCSLFDIYSNIDGFVSAFETGVPKASLSAGFSSANVPDGTTTIRVKAKGVCTNYTDINLTSITTTTTTTIYPSLACSEFTSSGGQGVSEFNITLDNPLGGYIVVEFKPYGVPDKLEIIHNGVKKATSGMTTSNSGPFDNLYGDPTIPNDSQVLATDQFIGSNKGTIPSRQSEFASETGSSLIMDSSYQQLIWWVYSASDFSIGNQVIIRITGPSGTVWDVKRLCETTPPISTTTTTTTSSSSSTTSTTTTSTTVPPITCHQWQISTTTDGGANFTNCLGEIETIYIGRASGNDVTNFCSLSSDPSEITLLPNTNLSYIGACME